MTLTSYWEATYERFGRVRDHGRLRAVCCPQAPEIYNRMFDAFQRRTVLGLLKEVGGLEGRRVLDLGCGFGRWTELLRRRGAAVVGVDHALFPLANARSTGSGAAVVQMDAALLGFRDSSLDGVVSITVLQHLSYQDQAVAIREIDRCTRPGGFVLMLEHTGARSPADNEGTATFPNPPELWTQRFQRHGFALQRVRPCLLLPLFRGYWTLRALLRSRLRVRAPRKGPAGPPPAPAVSGRINSAAYALLTPPSYVLERAIEACPALKARISQYLPVPQHGFLFRKEGQG